MRLKGIGFSVNSGSGRNSILGIDTYNLYNKYVNRSCGGCKVSTVRMRNTNDRSSHQLSHGIGVFIWLSCKYSRTVRYANDGRQTYAYARDLHRDQLCDDCLTQPGCLCTTIYEEDEKIIETAFSCQQSRHALRLHAGQYRMTGDLAKVKT